MLEESEVEELKSRLKNEFSDYHEIAGGQKLPVSALENSSQHGYQAG